MARRESGRVDDIDITRPRDSARVLKRFEGLVITTARMFAAQVGREEDDLAQELRVRCWRAAQSYDPSRSAQTLERYVFSAVANKIKDYKRDAAREARRRERHGLEFLHIEDTHTGGLDSLVSGEEVYASVERERFELPTGVLGVERRVLVLMMSGAGRGEVALLLTIERVEVDRIVRTLRLKLADWRPDVVAITA